MTSIGLRLLASTMNELRIALRRQYDARLMRVPVADSGSARQFLRLSQLFHQAAPSGPLRLFANA